MALQFAVQQRQVERRVHHDQRPPGRALLGQRTAYLLHHRCRPAPVALEVIVGQAVDLGGPHGHRYPRIHQPAGDAQPPARGVLDDQGGRDDPVPSTSTPVVSVSKAASGPSYQCVIPELLVPERQMV